MDVFSTRQISVDNRSERGRLAACFSCYNFGRGNCNPIWRFASSAKICHFRAVETCAAVYESVCIVWCGELARGWLAGWLPGRVSRCWKEGGHVNPLHTILSVVKTSPHRASRTPPQRQPLLKPLLSLFGIIKTFKFCQLACGLMIACVFGDFYEREKNEFCSCCVRAPRNQLLSLNLEKNSLQRS